MDDLPLPVEGQDAMETDDSMSPSASSAVNEDSTEQTTNADIDSVDQGVAAAADELCREVVGQSNEGKIYLYFGILKTILKNVQV